MSGNLVWHRLSTDLRCEPCELVVTLCLIESVILGETLNSYQMHIVHL